MTKRFRSNIYYAETNSPVQPSSGLDFIYGGNEKLHLNDIAWCPEYLSTNLEMTHII